MADLTIDGITIAQVDRASRAIQRQYQDYIESESGPAMTDRWADSAEFTQWLDALCRTFIEDRVIG